MESSDPTDLHRLIVRLTAAASWAVTLALAAIALTVGSTQMLLEALAPAGAAVLFTVQILTRRENAATTMAAGAVIVVATFPIVGTPDTRVAASLAVVTMAIVGTLFVHRHTRVFLALVTMCLIGVPILWGGALQGVVVTGLIMGFSYLVGASSFILIRRRVIAGDQRFRHLFERAPVALVEQDWSQALEFLSSLEPLGPDLLRQRLRADDALMDSIVRRIVVIRANAAAGRLFRTDRHQLLGPLDPNRISPRTREAWIDTVVGLWTGGTTTSLEYEDEDFGGRPGLWVEVKTIVFSPEEAPRVILALRDVSESRRRNRDLSDLVAAKDEFIATVSHELRTPLTAVLGLGSEILAATDLSSGEQRELMEVLVTQANEISYLVEDLLVGARADIGTVGMQAEPVDLTQEAASIEATLGGDIRIESTDGAAVAWADPVRVRQILRNLVVNAERYGGPNRRIVIASAESSVAVEVRDDGQPLPPDDRDRIFDAYTRAHDRPGVTMSVGLGLSVSRQLATLMGGDLSYHHDGNEGVFRLRLPVASTTPAQSDMLDSDQLLMASSSPSVESRTAG